MDRDWEKKEKKKKREKRNALERLPRLIIQLNPPPQLSKQRAQLSIYDRRLESHPAFIMLSVSSEKKQGGGDGGKVGERKETHGPTTSSTAPLTLFSTTFHPSCNSHQLKVR